MLSNQFINCENELKKLWNKVKNDIIPDSRAIHRMIKLIDHCKSAAY